MFVNFYSRARSQLSLLRRVLRRFTACSVCSVRRSSPCPALPCCAVFIYLKNISCFWTDPALVSWGRDNLEVFLTFKIGKNIVEKSHVITEWRHPFWNFLSTTQWCMNYWSLVDYLCTACVWFFTSGFSGKKILHWCRGFKNSCIKYDALLYRVKHSCIVFCLFEVWITN